ncbi:hypothetical protein [Pseudomonas sp. TMP9]|uniref:hypothetical protein n=1 Tax=unclassified Pseudomonas TaxID=196821 RepID=UPI0030CA5C63
MHCVKTLLVALMLGGSAAALAADNPQPLAVEPAYAPVLTQGWPAIRHVEHAWPQWMRNLTGTVLVLEQERPWAGMCAQLQCARVPGLNSYSPSFADDYEHAAQQPNGLAQVRHTSLPRSAQPDAATAQRFSF